jgi:peptide-methionine (R)-S-oxide reductase
MKDKCHMSDEEWKKKLDKVQFAVTRKKCTEKPFTGKYWDAKDQGVYRCVCCGQDLFASSAKFDSGCGWPSFCEPVDKERLEEAVDKTHNMNRTEVLCGECQAHLGHVFEDGPEPSGLRYCINSAALYLDKEAQDEPDQGDTQEIEPAGLAMPEDVDLADWIEPEDLDQTRD